MVSNYNILALDYTGFQKSIKFRQTVFSGRAKIVRKILLGIVAGRFKQPPFPTLQVSLFGLVPKEDGEYCLIHHLSYPEAASIIFLLILNRDM